MLQGETSVAEAAALGIGMVMAGSGDLGVIEKLLDFASNTDREKIQISISQAISMIMFSNEDKADTIIETML